MGLAGSGKPSPVLWLTIVFVLAFVTFTISRSQSPILDTWQNQGVESSSEAKFSAITSSLTHIQGQISDLKKIIGKANAGSVVEHGPGFKDPSLLKDGPALEHKPKPQEQKPAEKMVVVAGMKDEDYTWIAKELPDWSSTVYYPNDPTAPHHTLLNKGRETALYLAYIIENYDNLSSITAFVHSSRTAWHNDFGPNHDDNDLASGLKTLNTSFVQEQKYLNLRCSSSPGCFPPSVPLNDTAEVAERPSLQAYPVAFAALFPGMTLPDEIGSPSSAQFVVTKEQILARPRQDYEHYYLFVVESKISEWELGWIFEYSWHIIFGRPMLDCELEERVCRCEGFGWCENEKGQDDGERISLQEIQVRGV